MSENLKIFLIIVSILGIIVLYRFNVSPNLKLYKKNPWYIKLRIFLFSTKCNYCEQIACRVRDPGSKTYCLNSNCYSKAHPYNPFGQSDYPIDGSLGWKLNKEYKK